MDSTHAGALDLTHACACAGFARGGIRLTYALALDLHAWRIGFDSCMRLRWICARGAWIRLTHALALDLHACALDSTNHALALDLRAWRIGFDSRMRLLLDLHVRIDSTFVQIRVAESTCTNPRCIARMHVACFE